MEESDVLGEHSTPKKRGEHPLQTSPDGRSEQKKSRTEEVCSFLEQKKDEKIRDFLLRRQFYPIISQLHFDAKGDHKELHLRVLAISDLFSSTVGYSNLRNFHSALHIPIIQWLEQEFPNAKSKKPPNGPGFL